MIAELRRAALRAAKVLDRHVTQDDALLYEVESQYGHGTDDEFAAAVMAIVHAAEARSVAVPDPYLVLAELYAWRVRDRIDGTATDEATLRLRDIADRLGGG